MILLYNKKSMIHEGLIAHNKNKIHGDHLTFTVCMFYKITEKKICIQPILQTETNEYPPIFCLVPPNSCDNCQ